MGGEDGAEAMKDLEGGGLQRLGGDAQLLLERLQLVVGVACLRLGARH